MSRLLLVVATIGGVLGYTGYEEYTASQGASPEPTYVDLAELEQGSIPENNHLVIGPHWRIYFGSVFEYEQDVWEFGGPDPEARVNYTYYPIISHDHPFVPQLATLEEEYGDLARLPGSVLPEDASDISVLVKTHAFKTVASIPDGWSDSEEIQGLVINRIESLDPKVKKLIRKRFPSARVDEILLLEEGREPSSRGSAFAELGGGALLIFIGLGGLVMRSG